MQIYATARFDTVTDLLSAFMQPFSSGIVAQARPHLVHFLHINEINTFLFQTDTIFKSPSSSATAFK